MNLLKARNIVSQRCILKLSTTKFFPRRQPKRETNIEIYTDASIKDKQIGLGIWSDDNISMSHKITGLKDINRAEIAAIFCAVLFLYKQPFSSDVDAKAIIISDSKNAIECIRGTIYVDKFDILVRSIHYMMDNMEMNILLKKVKGHSGNVGNDNADMLARQSSESPKKSPHIILPDNIYREKRMLDNMIDDGRAMENMLESIWHMFHE
jgi:ribonuclease HI